MKNTSPFGCSAWIPVESEPVPEGLVCDMVREGWDRMTNVVYLDDWVYFEDAMHHDPNGDTPDPIELCPISEITHWAKIVLPNSTLDRSRPPNTGGEDSKAQQGGKAGE